MSSRADAAYLAFDGDRRIAAGDLRDVARVAKATFDRRADASIPVFDDEPKRPVAREITLLPRHWEWLARQPGGASVAIRKLVEEARRNGEHRDRIRVGQEAAYRFMSAMAGDRPHFEDAVRALFAPDPERFTTL